MFEKNCGLSFDFVLEVEKKELSVRPLKMIRDYWLLMMVYREKNAVKFKSFKHITSVTFKSFELANERVPEIEHL